MTGAGASRGARVFAGLPGPPAAPILGWKGNRLSFYRDPIRYMKRLRSYGLEVPFVRGPHRNIFTSFPGSPGTLFLFGSEHNHAVFSQPDRFHSFPDLGPLYPQPPVSGRRDVLRRLSSGLFSLNGAEHRRQRSLMLPAFQQSRIDLYVDDIVQITQQVLDRWSAREEIDAVREMVQLTLLASGPTLFGLDLQDESERLGRVLEEWSAVLFSAGVFLLPFDVPGLPYRRLIDRTLRLERLALQTIQRRREGGDGRDVLSALIRARDSRGRSLDDVQLAGHVVVLFVAGHETTSNTLAWALFLLSQYPRVAADVADEVRAVLGGGPPGPGDVQKLELLDRVLKETMRLFPAGPYAFRVVSEDVSIGGHEVPRGTEIGISHYCTHHAPELYAEPERFLPERWQRLRPQPGAYIPFSEGRRMCIGASFAMLEMKIVLSMILQRFWIELSPGASVRPEVTLTLRPRALPIRPRPIDGRLPRPPGLPAGPVHEMVELPS